MEEIFSQFSRETFFIISNFTQFLLLQEHSDEPILPGVLGGWRPDLQGKERQDSLQLERDVIVTTNYGQVQGFYVHLYDDPNPESLYRPGSTSVEYKRGRTTAFLGIPYAMPPVNEGRFKVLFTRIIIYLNLCNHDCFLASKNT